MNEASDTRRGFVKKAAYVAPAILTLAAAPAYVKAGSEKSDKGDQGNDKSDKDKLDKLVK